MKKNNESKKVWALYYTVLKVGKMGTWVACGTVKDLKAYRVCLFADTRKQAIEEEREMIEVDIEDKMKEKIIRVNFGIYADEM
jgi:3D (Asp-Asp-Asp) domain-containing protein